MMSISYKEIEMLGHLTIWGILLAAASAMVIGTLWYSPALFGKPWMKAIGLSEKEMQKRMSSVLPVLIVVSLVTAYVLGIFMVYYHNYAGGGWYKAGFYTALLVWLGFGTTTVLAHGLFEPRDMKVMQINIGNRLATLVAMGLILAAFMK